VAIPSSIGESAGADLTVPEHGVSLCQPLRDTIAAPGLPESMDEQPLSSAQPIPTPEEPVWKRVLSGASPREILSRLVDGDPLELRSRCEARLRSQAILLDRHRLQLRTAAHVARHAPGYAGSPPIDVWLAEKIKKAVQELIAEAVELTAAGEIAQPPDDDRLVAIAEAMGMDPSVLARGCVAFNRASFETRAAFFGLVLDGRDPHEWCRENSSTPERARASLKSALWALGVRGELDLDDWMRGEEDHE